jgi:hypothetical protein
MLSSLSELPTNKSPILWITLANNGYAEYVLNFAKSMSSIGVDFQLVVFCSDAELGERLAGVPQLVTIDARPYLPHSLSTALSTWSQSDYIRITFAKIDVMRIACESGVPFVGYIDTDIVLTRDPTETALKAFEADPSVQVVAQCGEGGYCSDIARCSELCTGVMVFRNSEELRGHLCYTEGDVSGHSCDQVYLTSVFHSAGVKTLTIHKDIWVNGGPYGPIYTPSVPKPADAELYHFNFLVGNEKREAMKRFDMWFL